MVFYISKNINIILDSICRVYESDSFHFRKKARYTVFFSLILIFYFIPAFLLNYFLADDSIFHLLTFPLYCLGVGLVILLVHKNRLQVAINLLFAEGAAQAVVYFLNPQNFQFYTHVIMCLIIAVAIHIRRYQLIFSLVFFNGLVLLRSLCVHSYFPNEMADKLFYNSSFQSLFGIIIITFTMLFLNRIVDQEIKKTEQLEEAALTDMLTGLSNRRKLEHFFDKIDSRVPLIMLLIDLDFFKRINDDFGHDTGDLVLVRFAGLLQNSFRGSDNCFRWGGEEFIVLMKNVPREEVLKISERFRQKVQNYDFGISRNLTISIGVAQSNENESFKLLFRRADMAMYRAKQEGRNRLIAV